MIDSRGSVHQQVLVGTGPGRAFDLVTAHRFDWWPPRHHIGSAPIEPIGVEPRKGGRWDNRHDDGADRGLDSYGPDTDRTRELYDDPDAWAGIRQAFADCPRVSA